MGDFSYEPDLVRALLKQQHPDLADLELTPVEGGWGNQQFRLGEESAVRMPRTPEAPLQLRHERRWLPELAERLPLPIPVPVRVGEPSELFEHPWSVVRWVAGEPADREPITDAESADALGGFLAALHHQAPDGVWVTERVAAPASAEGLFPGSPAPHSGRRRAAGEPSATTGQANKNSF